MSYTVREMSHDQLTLERLLLRLDKSHFSYPFAEEDLNKLKAGFKGECYIDSLTDPLNSPKFITIKNLTIPSYFETIQFDQIHITSSFILIVECKNVIGKITLQPDTGSMKREMNGVENYFRDPIWQLNRQINGLKNILREKKLDIPVYGYIVFTTTNSSIHTDASQSHLYKSVIKSEQLTHKIRTLYKENPKQVLTPKQISSLFNHLIEPSILPIFKDPLAKYKLNLPDLKHGISCLHCEGINLTKMNYFWKCTACFHSTRSLSKEQLADYFILVNPKAKLKDLQEFYLIKNAKSLKRTLNSLGVESNGNTNSKEYISWMHR
ncbi:nuclease-related domain-containing protein [Jeotgalibacillus sp. R-1-5s-1]|uniref:nuclease-related domain-containing protein n=1 Tax=Jeotgalibacillus sp. R-1-5s-1 TaxID=2555897 RepID=UPI00106A3DAE|nr:nuclease-related domain-containing protein [Jeotgalibacillus sp. R-1-5s-1]TFD97030.1 NERD domain-containing protein [Jeotgalibacillus sp. R-1-5s-1]